MGDTSRLPYVSAYLEGLRRGDPVITAAAGRHFHWGYWPPGERSDGTPRDYDVAAERLTRRLTEAARVRGGQRVLDVGCGIGGTVASLNERFSEMDLVGVNIDARQLERARSAVKARPGNTIEFIEGDACALPSELGDGSFDAILAVECIFHFPSRERFFEGARRLLKPGGRLVLTDGVPIDSVAPLLGVAQALGGPYMDVVSGPVDMRCTLDGYRALGDRTGLPLFYAEDITRETLPTFPMLRRLLPGRTPATVLYQAGVWGMEAASRLGLVRYCILVFG